MEDRISPPERKSTAAPPDVGRLLNIREAADYLGLSPRSIQTAARSGRLCTVRFSLRPDTKKYTVRYRRADLDRYIESCATQQPGRRPDA